MNAGRDEIVMAGGARRRTKEQAGGFWDRPKMMNLVADLLLFLATLAFGYIAVAVVLRLPLFPVREVIVVSPLVQVTSAQIEYAARSSFSGNFFTVNLDGVRTNFEKLPWVRRAHIRRLWPDGIALEIEEHTAVAFWKQGDAGETRLVNPLGEVFAAASNAALPVFSGPQGSAPEVLARYGEFADALAPVGHKLQAVTLSPRLAWQLRLDNGTVLELGRDQPKAPVAERLARFVAVLHQAEERLRAPVVMADLRYPNGLAVRTGRATRTDSKGK